MIVGSVDKMLFTLNIRGSCVVLYSGFEKLLYG